MFHVTVYLICGTKTIAYRRLGQARPPMSPMDHPGGLHHAEFTVSTLATLGLHVPTHSRPVLAIV